MNRSLNRILFSLSFIFCLFSLILIVKYLQVDYPRTKLIKALRDSEAIYFKSDSLDTKELILNDDDKKQLLNLMNRKSITSRLTSNDRDCNPYLSFRTGKYTIFIACDYSTLIIEKEFIRNYLSIREKYQEDFFKFIRYLELKLRN